MEKLFIIFAVLILPATLTVCQSPPDTSVISDVPEDPDRPLAPYKFPSPRTYDAGHDLEQLRGSMCGDNFDRQNFMDLKAMGANLVRWHLAPHYSELLSF